jgi:hypothetical protein
VVEVTAYRSERLVLLDARVRNAGSKPLKNLTVLFDFIGANKQVVTTQRTEVEDEELEPGK